jgi:hypothetical protein
MAYNVSRVGDVAPSPTRARGHVAERRAAAPRSPRRLLRRRCAYALLWDVASLIVTTEGVSYDLTSKRTEPRNNYLQTIKAISIPVKA